MLVIVLVLWYQLCPRGKAIGLNTPDMSRMSSVLFNRGINTQIGGSRKAAEALRELDVIKQQISNLTIQTIDIIELRNSVATLTAKNAELEGRVVALESRVKKPASSSAA